MAGKQVGALFTSHASVVTALFRVITVASPVFGFCAILWLKTIFPTQDQLAKYQAEVAAAYGNLPRAVEKLTDIAAEQRKWNETRQELPQRVQTLEEMAKFSREDRVELHKAIADHDRALASSDKQLAVINTQQAEMLRQIGETNRKLEKIGDKLGVP